MVLLQRPSVIVLDEPTAGMPRSDRGRLAEAIERDRRTGRSSSSSTTSTSSRGSPTASRSCTTGACCAPAPSTSVDATTRVVRSTPTCGTTAAMPPELVHRPRAAPTRRRDVRTRPACRCVRGARVCGCELRSARVGLVGRNGVGKTSLIDGHHGLAADPRAAARASAPTSTGWPDASARRARPRARAAGTAAVRRPDRGGEPARRAGQPHRADGPRFDVFELFPDLRELLAPAGGRPLRRPAAAGRDRPRAAAAAAASCCSTSRPRASRRASSTRSPRRSARCARGGLDAPARRAAARRRRRSCATTSRDARRRDRRDRRAGSPERPRAPARALKPKRHDTRGDCMATSPPHTT